MVVILPAKKPTNFSTVLSDEDATAHLAAQLVPMAQSIFADQGYPIIALRGDLGAGKTSFARSFISAAMGRPEEVPSPTFTLLQVYETPQEFNGGDIYHFDLYRLENPDDSLELGIEDAFSEGICLIEWPDRLGSWLPKYHLDLTLTHTDNPLERLVSLSTDDPRWIKELAALSDTSHHQ